MAAVTGAVVGVGIDLVAVSRIQKMLKRKGQRALDRLLTAAEQAYCLAQPVPARHVAARIAAKEAAYKAFQTAERARGIGWHEMEVMRDKYGRPSLKLRGHALRASKVLKVKAVLLSLSHTDDHAGAVVVLTK